MRNVILFFVLFLVAVDCFAERSAKTVRMFKSTHVCPANGKIGSRVVCKGYVVDHVIPLCAGGLDAVGNMQWQEYHESLVKDIQERAFCRALHGKL